MEWTGFSDEDLRRLQKSSLSSGNAFCLRMSLIIISSRDTDTLGE